MFKLSTGESKSITNYNKGTNMSKITIIISTLIIAFVISTTFGIVISTIKRNSQEIEELRGILQIIDESIATTTSGYIINWNKLNKNP